jgi:chromatin segregation and condensation protein Rec8/ScpA/Scc1 (kleisin family)
MDNIFPTMEQEAQRAADELYENKVQIKELLNKLNQIEKRLKAVAPAIEIKKPSKGKPASKQTFSEQYLKDKYENLSNHFKENTTEVLNELISMDKNELGALVKFLGVPVSQKPSQKKLIDLTVGRLKESKLLRN